MAMPGQMWPNPIKGYMDEMMGIQGNEMSNTGWKPEWNQYTGGLMDYIQGKIPDNNPVGWRGSQGLRNPLNQETWNDISKWYQGQVGKEDPQISGYSDWKDPASEYNRKRSSNEYMRMAGDTAGWQQEWSPYKNLLRDYLAGTIKTVTDPGTSSGGQVGDPTRTYMPGQTWKDIVSWYEGSGLPKMSDWQTEDPRRRFGRR